MPPASLTWTGLLALGLRENDLEIARQALELARADQPESAMRAAAAPILAAPAADLWRRWRAVLALLDLPSVWLWRWAAWRWAALRARYGEDACGESWIAAFLEGEPSDQREACQEAVLLVASKEAVLWVAAQEGGPDRLEHRDAAEQRHLLALLVPLVEGWVAAATAGGRG